MDQLIGKSDYDMPWFRSAHHFIEDDQEVMQSGQAKIGYEESQIVPGIEKNMRVSKWPLVLPDNTPGILCLFNDITELKITTEKLQREQYLHQESSRIKKDFLQQLCHDLKTPLSTISGNVQDILENHRTHCPSDILNASENIASSSTQMLHMIQNFMQHGESGRTTAPIQKEPISTQELIESVALAQKNLLEKNNNRLSHTLDAPKTIFTDRLRTESIIHNLVGNAVKYTTKGSIHVSIKIQNHQHKTLLVLTVSDNGPGIEENLVPDIFQAFRKLRPSYKTGDYQGSGLGLHVTKRYIEELGGTLTLDTKINEGTNFSAVWPIEVSQKIIASPQPKNPTILCVEDVKNIMAIHTLMLEKLGCTVHQAFNAAEALDLFKSLDPKPDICFIDLGLPDMDGERLAQALRKLPKSAHTLFVCISAHTLDVQYINKNTFDHFIQKPCRLGTFESIIKSPSQYLQ